MYTASENRGEGGHCGYHSNKHVAHDWERVPIKTTCTEKKKKSCWIQILFSDLSNMALVSHVLASQESPSVLMVSLWGSEA